MKHRKKLPKPRYSALDKVSQAIIAEEPESFPDWLKRLLSNSQEMDISFSDLLGMGIIAVCTPLRGAPRELEVMPVRHQALIVQTESTRAGWKAIATALSSLENDEAFDHLRALQPKALRRLTCGHLTIHYEIQALLSDNLFESLQALFNFKDEFVIVCPCCCSGGEWKGSTKLQWVSCGWKAEVRGHEIWQLTGGQILP